jgi:ParB family chromosome partitioning protein
VADEVVRKLLSVRETEALVARATAVRAVAADGAMTAGAATPVVEDPNVRAAQENLQRRLGTKVRIVRKGAGGRIEVEFYSEEELDRLYTAMMRGH